MRTKTKNTKVVRSLSIRYHLSATVDSHESLDDVIISKAILNFNICFHCVAEKIDYLFETSE